MKYQKIIQEAINYIETHLHDKITLEDVSNEMNYSKYHFHRVFKNQVGINFYDYVRKRRLANASRLLIYSEMKVLDIALLYKFDSHKAFTRSFQSLYQLSPSRYRNIMRANIRNKKQEEIIYAGI